MIGVEDWRLLLNGYGAGLDAKTNARLQANLSKWAKKKNRRKLKVSQDEGFPMASAPTTCFVIMPFSQTTSDHTEAYWTGHFEGFLKPCIANCGPYEAVRSTPIRGDIVREIVTHLITSPIVVADLTDANSNVYWELGVRQSFKHGTVTIAQIGTKLPFDIGGKGTLFYEPGNHVKMESFRSALRAALEDCTSHPNRPDSHVLETISGRGSIYELVQLDEAIRRLDALDEEVEETGKTLSRILDTAKENQASRKDKKGIATTTQVLRVAALELLITTRYLDQNVAFYDAMVLLYQRYLNINHQLLLWENNSKETDAWLLTVDESSRQRLKLVQEKLAQARKAISKRV